MKRISAVCKRYQNAAILAGLAFLAVFPLLTDSSYLLHVGILICIYSVLSLSLNLVTGYAGQLVLGHAAFYGIGAYVGALLMLNFNINFFLAMLLSALVTGLFGLLLGLPTLRLDGDYLAIVTLGFGEIVRLVFVNWVDVTNGSLGLRAIPHISVFDITFKQKIQYYYLILIFLILVVVFTRRLIHSGIGMCMQTVKADEIASESIGIRPFKYKLMAFILSAALAGSVGCFYASYVSCIAPTTFSYNTSVTILAMAVLGGLGSIPGSIIGATVLQLIPELLRFLAKYRMLIYGLVMVVMMIFRPEGFWGAGKRTRNSYQIIAGGKNYGGNTQGK